MVTTLSTGEGYTSSPCPICRRHHRVITDETAERLLKIGMTPAEVAAIKGWTEREYKGFSGHAPDDVVEETREERRRRLTRERVAKWKAARR